MCSQCREQLTSAQLVSRHQSEHHPGALPQPCVVCRQTLLSTVEVKVHAKYHGAQNNNNNNDYVNTKNKISKKSYGETMTPKTEKKEIFSNIVKSDLVSDSLKCPLCQIKLETLEEAENHSCSVSRTTSPENTSTNHVKSRQNSREELPKTYQCIKCQESFSSESDIEAHVSLHLQTADGSRHECHLCQDNFDTPLRLQCHLIEHTFEGCGSYTCYLCSSVFTAAPRLQQHMHEHGLNARPYDCHHCHLKFFFKAELENHVRNHPESSSGSCKECNESVQHNGKVGINKIKRIKSVSQKDSSNHNGNLNFSEDIKSDVHQATGARMNGCADDDNLNYVKSSGLVCKSVSCGTCSRRCKSDASRQLHELTHEGARPYLCSCCGLGFTRKCEARKHLNSKHSSLEDSTNNGTSLSRKIKQESDDDKNISHENNTSIHKPDLTQSLRISDQIEKDPLSFYCGSCSRNYDTPGELKTHVATAHCPSDHLLLVRSDSRCSSCSDEE